MRKFKKANINKVLKSILIMLSSLILAFAAAHLLVDVFNIGGQVTALFIFVVFIVSVFTEGYVYGILTAVIGMLLVNYAFTFPYFEFNFSASENIMAALVMTALSVMTSTLTIRLKVLQRIKAEADMEILRANLLRAVSHDLRTPLTTIYGSSCAMFENYDNLNDGQKLELIKDIMEDSDWLIRMVENLLSITKIEDSKGSLNIIKTPVVLEEVIDSVIKKFKKRYPGVKLDIDIPQEVVVIPMDAILIEQVILNILENAVKHAHGMTRVKLLVYVNGDKAVFEISDDGCGIEKEKIGDIFLGQSNFENSGCDSSRRNAGIGLRVCSTIISAHGGKISCESKRDRGTVFKFSLYIDGDVDFE